MNKKDRIESNELRRQMFSIPSELDNVKKEAKLTKAQILKEEINGEVSISEELQASLK